MDKAFEKLERIQQLYKEVEKTKPNTREYQALMAQISVLSAEFQALI
jgi:hypothetical protein